MEWWDRLQARMDELGLKKVDLAEKSGVPYDSINKYLRGDIKQPRGNVMKVLADAIGRPLLWLRDGIDETTSDVKLSLAAVVPITVVGTVDAGMFREVDEFDQSIPEEIYLPRDEKFPNARLVAFNVSGDSMNDLRPRPIFSGDRLICVSYEDVAHEVELRDGMVVVVQRTRDGGHFREWSVKQIELYTDRVEFCPRSTNPKHKPIVVKRDDHADDGVQVEVIALVRRVMNDMPGF